jgi:hypothetical protein
VLRMCFGSALATSACLQFYATHGKIQVASFLISSHSFILVLSPKQRIPLPYTMKFLATTLVALAAPALAFMPMARKLTQHTD